MPSARCFLAWRAAPHARQGAIRRFGFARPSCRRCSGSTTRCAGTRRTWTPSSGSRSAGSSPALISTAAPSAWCGRRDSSWRPSGISSSAPCQLGIDEHQVRDRLARGAVPCGRSAMPWSPWATMAFDPHGLHAADWDLLARMPGLERLDVVVTDSMLAGALHERMHTLLPGIEEVRVRGGRRSTRPCCSIPTEGATRSYRARSRGRSGRFRPPGQARGRDGGEAPGAHGARRPAAAAVRLRGARGLRSAGVPCQMFDALPLAAEPYAAALDLVFSAVTTGFGRAVSIALLRSPHFRFDAGPRESIRRRPCDDIAALDRALSESGYLGELQALESLLASLGRRGRARGVSGAMLSARAPCCARRGPRARAASRPAPVQRASATLIAFLERHENLPGRDDPPRGRAAAGARRHPRHASRPCATPTRGSITAPSDSTTLRRSSGAGSRGRRSRRAPGDAGVHLVDAESARFGDFDAVQLAGLVDGEWPERPRRNIFYSPGILRELGWPAEADRREAARAAFADLLRPAGRRASSCRRSRSRPTRSSARRRCSTSWRPGSLDDDGGARRRRRASSSTRRSASSRCTRSRCSRSHASGPTHRLAAATGADRRRRGFTGAHQAPALLAERARALSGLSVQVLRRRRPAARGGRRRTSRRSRRARAAGSSTRCFSASSRRGTRERDGAITPDRLDEARALFAQRSPSRCSRGCRRPTPRSSAPAVRLGDLRRGCRRRARARSVAARSTCASAGSSIGSRGVLACGDDRQPRVR